MYFINKNPCSTKTCWETLEWSHQHPVTSRLCGYKNSSSVPRESPEHSPAVHKSSDSLPDSCSEHQTLPAHIQRVHEGWEFFSDLTLTFKLTVNDHLIKQLTPNMVAKSSHNAGSHKTWFQHQKRIQSFKLDAYAFWDQTRVTSVFSSLLLVSV